MFANSLYPGASHMDDAQMSSLLGVLSSVTSGAASPSRRMRVNFAESLTTACAERFNQRLFLAHVDGGLPRLRRLLLSMSDGGDGVETQAVKILLHIMRLREDEEDEDGLPTSPSQSHPHHSRKYLPATMDAICAQFAEPVAKVEVSLTTSPETRRLARELLLWFRYRRLTKPLS
jgi:hypothetical protein